MASVEWGIFQQLYPNKDQISMKIDDSKNKEKIAVVVVGYNRIVALRRLLSSLRNAHYTTTVPLYLSIDASGDRELYDFVHSYEWPYGDKYVNIQEERLGLKNHIIQCGDLTRFFKAIILLEDDIFVSEYFYEYVERVVEYYYKEDRIAGFSLINSEMGYPGLPQVYMLGGSDAFLRQSPASWGECWTEKQWRNFKLWYESFSDEGFSEIDMPSRVKGWKKAWSKYYMAYMVTTNRYFLYPYISHTTCFGDAGEHASSLSSISQTNLLAGPKKYFFQPFEELIKYDSYGINELVYNWIGYSQESLCVDWACLNQNIRKCRYILTPAILPFKVVRTFGMQMRPIELNIKYGIAGSEIKLYDTEDGNASAYGEKMPLSFGFYHLRSFNMRLTARYAVYKYLQVIKDRILFWK